MSCPRTKYILQEYPGGNHSEKVWEDMHQHLESCEFCRSELKALEDTRASLLQWKEQPVPHWDRLGNTFRGDMPNTGDGSSRWPWMQWVPTLATCLMLGVMLLNVTVVVSESGTSISFGASAMEQVEARLAQFGQQQEEEMQGLVSRFEQRQDANNLLLMQSVIEQSQQVTTENLEQIYAYFEQQRLRDLEDMRVGYQQLVDSDYETIRSLQQLASYVSYEGDIR